MNLRIFKTFLTVLCAFSVLFVFSGCAEEREIYAESSDFASYPDYWNDFNSSHDSVDASENTTGETEIITDNSSVDSSIINDASSDNSSVESPSNDVSSADGESSDESESTPSEGEDEEDTPSHSKPDLGNQGPIVFF